jgi:colanic acid biosynthesis glycosyl transferase WcaI
MKILLYGINFYPELTGVGKYTGELAFWLVEKGYEVVVVTAHPYYPEWKLRGGKLDLIYRIEKIKGVTVIRCPIFVPEKVTKAKRILHLMSFAVISIPALIIGFFQAPTYVVNIVPTIFTSPFTLVCALLFRSKAVLHVQDFESDAMIALFARTNTFVIKLIYWVEGLIFRSFWRVTTISEELRARAIAKGAHPSRVHLFRNWSSINQNARKGNPVISERLNGYIFDNDRLVVYAGNIGEKQGLEILIDVIQGYENEATTKFLIVGDGVARGRLESECCKRGLQNVRFIPVLSDEDFVEVMGRVDCHIVIQKKGISSMVMPSKIANIFSMGGNAVVSADENTTLHIACKENPGLAEYIDDLNYDKLVVALGKCLSMPKPNNVAMTYAAFNFSKTDILSGFEKILIG